MQPLQDVSKVIPPYVSEQLLQWKVEHGGLIMAPFRPKVLNEDGQLISDASAPWTISVLRDLTLKEYLAYAELAEFDSKVAAHSLVRLVHLCTFIADEVGTAIDIETDEPTLDFLFGQYIACLGFFRGNAVTGMATGDVMGEQRTTRTEYGKLYHNFVVTYLVGNLGMKPNEAEKLTDRQMAELYYIYNRPARQREQKAITHAGMTALERKQALTNAAAGSASRELAEKLIAARQGRSEKLNIARENAELAAQFPEAIVNRPIPNVTKLRHAKELPSVAPKTTHRKANG